MKKEGFYLSCDKKTRIHAVAWKPEGQKVRAVVQICHGMAEYIDRYEEFAIWLSQKGYYVNGHDHLGHGKSVRSEEDYGYFPDQKGNECVIGDIRKLFLATRKNYPDCPYFMMGHSMGSFLLRQYIQKYGNELDGAVIMGTGYQPYPLLLAGELLCGVIGKVCGSHYRSRLVDGMAFGSYNEKFEPGKTGREWLSSEEENVSRYEADPLCGFLFTVGGYRQMFRGMRTLTKKGVKRIPKDLPVLFVSGSQDPVGDFGAGVWKVYEQFRDAGMTDVTIRLFPEDRHEILHEKDRLEVFEEIESWLEKHRETV